MSVGIRVKTSGELAGLILSEISYLDKCDDPDPGLQLIQFQVQHMANMNITKIKGGY